MLLKSSIASKMAAGNKLKKSTYDIAMTGVAIAIIEVCKTALKMRAGKKNHGIKFEAGKGMQI